MPTRRVRLFNGHGVVRRDANSPSRLLALTVSIDRKRQPKVLRTGTLPPFRTGGGMRCRSEITDRRCGSGLHHSSSDESFTSLKEESRDNSSTFLAGPFLHTSSRARWQTLAPLSYQRLPPTVQVHARPSSRFHSKRNIQTAPAFIDTANSALASVRAKEASQPPSRPSSGHSSVKKVKSKSPRTRSRNESLDLSPEAQKSVDSEQNNTDRESLHSSSPRKSVSRNASRKSIFKKREQFESNEGNKSDTKSEAMPISADIVIIKEDSDEMKVFKRYQEDNMVHVDDLRQCLQGLGYAYPSQEWILEIKEEVTFYSQLSKEKFMVFVNKYKERQRGHHRLDFERMDEDDSGTLDKQEFAILLNSFGIYPMSHVLDEVFDEVDEDGSGSLDFDEFEKVIALLRYRQGFSLSEYDEICSIFRMFGENGEMDTVNFRCALEWLGISMSQEQVDAIIRDIDLDRNGKVDELEWITGMRKVRESKIEELRYVMETNDTDGDGSIQFEELMPMLCALGYFPDEQAVKEAAFAAGIAEDHPGLDISEMWRFMKVYRNREGLSKTEVEEIEQGYLRCGFDPTTEVNAMQIGKIVRSIGYMISFDTMQNFIAKVDINNSGDLDSREFRKLIRLVIERDIETFRLAFYETAQLHSHDKLKKSATFIDDKDSEDESQYRILMPGFKEVISVNQARHGLKRLGCVDADDKVAPLLVKDKVARDQVDVYGFCTAARRCRQAARAAFRQNGGFSKEDIRSMEQSFKRYDSDHSGQLTGGEIVKVLVEHFPTLAGDVCRRPLIQKLLKEADEDDNGKLDFPDFLRLMRQVKDIQDQLMITKELKAIEETQFSPTEVYEFRELLLAVRGEAKEIGFDEVKGLLGAIVPMGAKNLSELQRKFKEVAGRQSGVEGSEDMLDFPEFLWLMRELLDINFANMAGLN